MLTITYNHKKLYINIALLKKRLKSAFITLLKVSTFILAFSGIFWIIGTEGASERIATTQMFMQFFQGILLCGIAWVLNFIKLAIE